MWTISAFLHIKSQNSPSSASLTSNCRKSKTLSLTRNANGLVGGEQIEAVDKFIIQAVKSMREAVQIWTLRAELEKPDLLLVFSKTSPYLLAL